jgi:hypothetical protein
LKVEKKRKRSHALRLEGTDRDDARTSPRPLGRAGFIAARWNECDRCDDAERTCPGMIDRRSPRRRLAKRKFR